MKPLDLDGLIRKRIQEGENKIPLPDKEERDRTWNRIRARLESRPRYTFIRYAALILFLLLPSCFLWVQNRQQKKEIASLRIEARGTGNPVTVIRHDTIRMPGPIVIRSRTDTVEVIRYVTDTVPVYRQNEMAGTEYPAAEPQATDTAVAPYRRNDPEIKRTEYVLSGISMPGKQSRRTGKLFSFRFQ